MNRCSWLFSRISQFLAREGLLPIDAKFPHDSFERVVAAGGRKSGWGLFARAEIHLTFFQAVSGVEGGQDV
jgi:hypothetical protein